MAYKALERLAGMGARHERASGLRRGLRTGRALLGLTLRRSPKWARVVAVACIAIPGPLDELVVWPALLVYVALRYRGEFAAVARAAWQA